MLEVISHTLEDINNLNNSKADRIELCRALDQDGLTPDLKFVEEVLSVTKKPIRVIIRPRDEFITNPNEVEEMIQTIRKIKRLGNSYLDGFVMGYITPNGDYDHESMSKLIAAAKPYKITYHKASDFFISDLKFFEEFGVDTVLTQGTNKEPIEKNVELLTKLRRSDSKVELLLGGGVTLENIEELASISSSIHIGSLARFGKSYGKEIDVDMVNRIANIINRSQI